MRLRFGYVAHPLMLWNATPSKTMTFSRWNQLDPEQRLEDLNRITRTNLEHTIRALHHNIAQEIELYRFSSSLVPLATHQEVDWDYITPFQDLYLTIGDLVKEHGLRTSFHPNQFTLFTSDKAHVSGNAVHDMNYHYAVLEAMGLEKQAAINLHVGGAYGNKSAAIDRFHANLKQLSKPVKQQMTLENDDKTYTATETLEICEREGIAMMFDYHHYWANRDSEESLEELLPRIFQTWQNHPWPPKVHISSPKSEQQFRSHADYVDVEFAKPFLKQLKAIDQDVDVMIEAKQKDKAALQFVEDVAAIRGVKRIGGASIIW
ncbi:UV DNA damage repair endonuclease UvsE [Thalassobacillus sp. CUG 92003]|uniref:UV DNA damage repair endonuclease UvsE n=1 Tax=Thalassobacillus sp. CUG 92003 TaxID=2736641 RepID=UPI0015E69BD3|nr:UV DNA damage repair endonuclease UvsE [Thalassobacillus sp. CUG 92003]